ncbi:DUF2189 domain-containing protein [Ideonella sp.]|uniref:DUF2189 domain-containing protein n=1 Tax=Ideonella sp. TaxID=1929293 RepID=UPI002B45AF98|nr:DUF2189 domain-containing protein [Ideonella sp.]HJV72178.1 DUF2189 domain-containing protein [Ideonella sp.]
MDHVIDRSHGDFEHPAIRRVRALQPLAWLRLGYSDLAKSGVHSFAHGAGVAVLGVLLLMLVWRAPYMVPAYLGGFLLVAPFAAIGLYAISRQLDQGQAIDPRAALRAWRDNAGSVALFGLMLAVALIFWERAAAVLFALLYSGSAPDASRLLEDLLFSGRQSALLLAFFGAGAVLATVVFTLSVVTVPMLLDRPVDVITAALTSLRCCARNPAAMAVWAVLIAGLTILGFATAMLGLVVVFPLLGHASWRAYRDMVD